MKECAVNRERAVGRSERATRWRKLSSCAPPKLRAHLKGTTSEGGLVTCSLDDIQLLRSFGERQR